MVKKITKKAVDALNHKSRPSIIWDSRVSGFGVRVRATGKKYFFIKYRTKTNRQRWYTIGRFGSPWTVDGARDRALKILTIVKDGGDPIAERAIEKGIPTLGALCKDYIKEVKAGNILTRVGTPFKESTLVTDEIRINNYIIPLLGKIRLDAITPEDIKKFRRQVTQGKGAALSKSTGGMGAASRTMGTLSGILSYAVQEKYISNNPAIGVQRPKGKKMQRFLTVEEFSRLGEVLVRAEKTENQYTLAAIRLLIFTGCRKSEILELKWSYVDLGKGMLFLPDSKTGAKVIYLSAPASEIFKDLDRQEGNPYVICGIKEGHHLVNIGKPWGRIRKQAKLDNLRLHDLRHSFASIGASGGVPLQIIGKLLGHAHASTTERYAHLSADPVKAANEAMAQEIQAALAGKPKERDKSPADVDKETIPQRRGGQ